MAFANSDTETEDYFRRCLSREAMGTVRSGKLPEFESDFDPRRWRYTGPYAQLASAIVVVIKTNQG